MRSSTPGRRDRRFLVGTYTDLDVLAHTPQSPWIGSGIVHCVLDTGRAMRVEAVTKQTNPAVIVRHPSAPVVYGITETIAEPGRIARYRADGSNLVFLDEWTSTGRATCALVVAPACDAAVVVDYWDGVLEVVRLDEQGAIGETTQRLEQRRGNGRERQVEDRDDHWSHRQVGPHPHDAVFWHGRVFVPDLGADAVFQYRWDAEALELELEALIECPPGSGPRHITVHPRLPIAYVVNELASTVLVGRLDAGEARDGRPCLRFAQLLSTLGDRSAPSFAAEIVLSGDGRFLLVSNRGDDSMAVFAVQPDGLLGEKPVITPTGRFPRSFALSNDGCDLLVAAQDDSLLEHFDRDTRTGELRRIGELAVPSPSVVVFAEH